MLNCFSSLEAMLALLHIVQPYEVLVCISSSYSMNEEDTIECFGIDSSFRLVTQDKVTLFTSLAFGISTSKAVQKAIRYGYACAEKQSLLTTIELLKCQY